MEFEITTQKSISHGDVAGQFQNLDLSNIEFETSDDVDVIPTFDSMGMREELLRGIYSYGG